MARRSRTFKRKTRKIFSQKGGFSYAVMEGVRGAALLLPIAIRQGISLLRNGDKTQRRKSRKLRR